jgi:predicted phage-related endonuclease
MLEQRQQLKDAIKQYEARCDEIESELQFKMGDADRAIGLGDFSVTWRNQHRDAYSVEAKDFRALRIHRREAKSS